MLSCNLFSVFWFPNMTPEAHRMDKHNVYAGTVVPMPNAQEVFKVV